MLAIARIYLKNDSTNPDANEYLWNHVIEKHNEWTEFDVKPLYITQQIEHHMTSIIVELKDTNDFADLIAKYITPFHDINGISLFDLIKPRFFPVPKGTPTDYKRYVATINVEPKEYSTVYDKIAGIWTANDSVVTYMAFSFQAVGKDIMVSFISQNRESASSFSNNFIVTISGVLHVDLDEITRTKQLVSSTDWKDYIKTFSKNKLYSDDAEDVETWEYDEKFVCC